MSIRIPIAVCASAFACACASRSELSVEGTGTVQESAAPAAPAPAPPESGYALPPPEVVAIVDAPPTPRVSVSPDGRWMLLTHYDALPSLEELAEPLVRLAGLRIHPGRGARQQTRYDTAYELENASDGRVVRVDTPAGARMGGASWSPDGARFSFELYRDEGVELWMAEASTGKARRLLGPWLNGTLGSGASWWSGSDRMLVRLVPETRGAPPPAPRVPYGPVVSETAGRKAQNRTYQDLLTSRHDEALFEHFATCQLAELALDGELRALGSPGIYSSASPSPSGEYVLVHAVQRPYSYTVPVGSFAQRVEVWDRQGRRVHTVAELPVADEVPIGGVPTGPRSIDWQAGVPATLVWAEALDGGDPDVAAEHRDRLMGLAAPFDAEAQELALVVQRFRGLSWTDLENVAFVTEFDRDRRWLTTTMRDLWDPSVAPRVLFDRSQHDRYGDPGRPLRHRLANGDSVVLVEDGRIWLEGDGASAEGERPFLDRLELATGATERLFQSPAEAHTSFVDFVAGPDRADRSWLMRREAPRDPPNWFRLDSGSEELVALTRFADPHPELTGIEQELLRYERADGVPMSGTLYLPPGYQPGTRLPLLVWAYPIEYTDASVAGQVRVTTNRFTRLAGTSPLMLLTQGYAVLDNAAMPVVGDPETMNETFLEQIVAAADAAIAACVERGVADPDRVAIGGHSYGAFMTANLLAHSDLFRAGIARSGAYNRSLTPFGFQSERRTVWEATETYIRVSPFFHAHSIDEPLLLIHGEIDDNSGTFPLQTQRLYHAIEGLGGTARFVQLPHEAHGYAARESVLHVLAESIEWLDRYVKDASPRSQG